MTTTYAGENIILTRRRHPITLVLSFLLLGMYSLIPPSFLWALSFFQIHLSTINLSQTSISLCGTLIYLYLLLAFLYTFFNYYSDIWMVTDQHVISIEQKSLFFRTVSKNELHKIQDMTIESRGVLATLMNFGDIYIQTAGETERFIFRQIHRPHAVVEHITKLLDSTKKEPL